MNISVVYSSTSGNTKRLAESVAEQLTGTVRVVSIKDKPDVSHADLVIPAFWVMEKNPDPQTKRFLSTITGTNVFLIGTIGYYPDSVYGMESMINAAALLGEGCTLMGTFLTSGKVSDAGIKTLNRVYDKGGTDNPHAKTPDMLLIYDTLGVHPTELDIRVCAERINERIKLITSLAALDTGEKCDG